MTRKGFALPLLLLLTGLILGGGLVYFLVTNQTKQPIYSSTSNIPQPLSTQSSPISSPADETANWKTYTNTTLGFTFMYPSNWKESALPTSSIQSPDTKIDNVHSLTTGTRVLIETYSYGKTIESNVNALFSDCAQKNLLETFMIGPHSAKEYSYFCPGSPENSLAVIIQGNDNVFVIRFETIPQNTNKQVFDQILSTFKFTN